jgi:hypothetical protein
MEFSNQACSNYNRFSGFPVFGVGLLQFEKSCRRLMRPQLPGFTGAPPEKHFFLSSTSPQLGFSKKVQVPKTNTGYE